MRLSIAKNLTELQNGEFLIYLDGDLFKVTVKFPLVSSDNTPEDLVMTAEESETVGEEQAQEQEEIETETKKGKPVCKTGKKRTGSIRERKNGR